jgi:hypothetical protein
MDNPQPIEKRFIFFGNAVAFAARIRRPTDHRFPAVASSCLPVTGGAAAASSGPQNFQDMISFRSAATSAVGDFADTRRAVDFTHGNHGDNELSTQTFVDSRLSGLKISVMQDHPPQATGKIVTFAAEELHARLEDEQIPGFTVGTYPQATGKIVTFAAEELHARLESSSDRRTPTAFRGLEATFQGVTVDGHELLVPTVTELCTHYETYDKLVTAYQDDSDFRKRFGSCFYLTGQEKTGVGALLSKPTIPGAGGGIIVATIAPVLRWAKDSAPGCQITGNRLQIAGVGSVYFGELVFEEESRRLTLLRFQLGSPTGAEASAVEVHSNGHTWPPQ